MIDLSRNGGVAILTLNRPEKRNALNDELRGELVEALERLHRDASLRALVLTGGGKAFCAGGDVDAMRQRLDTPAGDVAFNGWKRQQQTHHAQMLLHDLPVPTIAAVNGDAVGLGADLALACDFVMAASTARFMWSYVHRGLIPDGGAMYFLPRRVGLTAAKELIFTGRPVDSAEAVALGIADRLAEPDLLVERARQWAAELGERSPVALALSKSILNVSFESSLPEIFARGSQAQGICYTSVQHREAVEAFLNARAASGPITEFDR